MNNDFPQQRTLIVRKISIWFPSEVLEGSGTADAVQDKVPMFVGQIKATFQSLRKTFSFSNSNKTTTTNTTTISNNNNILYIYYIYNILYIYYIIYIIYIIYILYILYIYILYIHTYDVQKYHPTW